MDDLSEQTYQRNLALKAVRGFPKEDTLYAIFNDFLALHQRPLRRFTIYPQMNLKWKPTDQQDRRSEIPDVGLGNFMPPGIFPFFKLRCGIEAKRAIRVMSDLPPPESLMTASDVMSAFHTLFFQAQNQAKAAYKNKYPLSNDGIQWILLVGPYWLPRTFGPFSEPESTVRAHKVSGSADFDETMKLLEDMEGPPPEIQELYLLGTPESFTRLEEIVAYTDVLAQPFIEVRVIFAGLFVHIDRVTTGFALYAVLM
jgi:hypothetical protein